MILSQISQGLQASISIDPRILDQQGNVVEDHEIQFSTYCYDVVNGDKNRCTVKVTITSAVDETCLGVAGIQCGHVDAQHTPASRSVILGKNDNETARILGGLTNEFQKTMTTKLEGVTRAGDYYYYYSAGEITGQVNITQVANGLPEGWKFLPPCESEDTCTYLTPVITEHCGDNDSCQRFVELDAPIPPTEENQPWGDGYVRCGMSSDCFVPDPPNFNPAEWLQYDKPNNWPAHPTTNWGQWQFLDELKALARRWYITFKKPLVINDMTLTVKALTLIY